MNNIDDKGFIHMLAPKLHLPSVKRCDSVLDSSIYIIIFLSNHELYMVFYLIVYFLFKKKGDSP